MARMFNNLKYKKHMLAVFSFFLLFMADFGGIQTYTALSIMSSYVKSTNETLEISNQIFQECGTFEPWNCYVNRVMLASQVEHIMVSTPPRWIQSPAITLKLEKGNCVDKSILEATLLKELGMQHVYLVSQPRHVCVMVAHPAGWQTLRCFSNDPIVGVLEV